MTVDASPVDVGAVLSHKITDRSEKPIYFASRTEQEYVQIEREGLAVIFEVSKFYEYIYGLKFTITASAFYRGAYNIPKRKC